MSYPYFQISKKSGYAIRALFELALRSPSAPINVRSLAKAQDLPVRFLEIILNELKQGGFVLSVRGKSGGYLLSKPAGQITVGQIIRFLEKTSESKTPSLDRPHPGEFTFNRLMNEINRNISDLCDSANLEKMVEEYKNNQEAVASNYVI